MPANMNHTPTLRTERSWCRSTRRGPFDINQADDPSKTQ